MALREKRRLQVPVSFWSCSFIILSSNKTFHGKKLNLITQFHLTSNPTLLDNYLTTVNIKTKMTVKLIVTVNQA
jgi:hypothetical protein